MKRIFNYFMAFLIIMLVYNFREEIFIFYNSYCAPIEKRISELEKNEYYRNYDFTYVENTKNFIPTNKTDIKNIYYTIVNSGMTEFTFYCPSEYQSCMDDVNEIANDQNIISNINNFVHPYNSFNSLKTEIDSLGKITIEIEKVYNDEMIILIDYKINEIYKDIIGNNNFDNKTKIKTIHDYIINTTKYDSNRSDRKIINYKSDTAYGPLIEGYGLCGGYTDAMALFLDYYKIPNFKVISENHIWNAVKLDGKWYHLDLTWDDPISKSGNDILEHTFFLIRTDKLLELEKEQHIFDQNIFKELIW